MPKSVPRTRRLTQAQNRNLWFWAFVAPFIIGLVVFAYIPIGWSFYLSFFDARNTVTPTSFVGFDNYLYLLTNQSFLTSMVTFIAFAMFIVPVTCACSLGLALLLQRITFMRAFFRSVFFLPSAVSYVIAAMIWRLGFFNGSRFGLANTLLRDTAGMEPIGWLTGEASWHWVVLVSLRLWLQVGFYMILFIAGLNRIPQDTYEAAALDGATGWRTFRYITLPLLRPTTVAVLMLLLIGAFQAFDEFYNVLTSTGGYPPFGRPPLVYLYLISLGGGSQDLGVGSAGTMILTVVILAFGLLQQRVLAIGGRNS